jgi:hypothetical protein
VYAFNPDGFSVGYTSNPSQTVTVPALWDTTGTPIELPGLSPENASAYVGTAMGINASGMIVGQARKMNGAQDLGLRAVRWNAEDHSVTELGNLGTSPWGFTILRADVVNAAGTAVGWGRRFNSNGQQTGTPPIRWEAGSTVATELDSFEGGTNESEVYSINASGTAVGFSRRGHDSTATAARWDGNSTAISELYGIGPDEGTGTISTLALGINDHRGTVVGYEDRYTSHASFTSTHAIRWDAGTTTPTALGELGTDNHGRTNSRAYAINANEIAVGFARIFSGGNFAGNHAVAWGPDGIAIDLNLLIDPASGWTLVMADDITANNWVTGTGLFDPDGPGGAQPYYRGFLLQIPEPALLGALSLLPVGLRRRRRSNLS